MRTGQRPASYMVWKMTRMLSILMNQKVTVASISQKL